MAASKSRVRTALERPGAGVSSSCHFLISSLDGAIALADGQNLAFPVAKDLNLDVACQFNKSFEINSALFEIGLSRSV